MKNPANSPQAMHTERTTPHLTTTVFLTVDPSLLHISTDSEQNHQRLLILRETHKVTKNEIPRQINNRKVVYLVRQNDPLETKTLKMNHIPRTLLQREILHNLNYTQYITQRIQTNFFKANSTLKTSAITSTQPVSTKDSWRVGVCYHPPVYWSVVSTR